MVIKVLQQTKNLSFSQMPRSTVILALVLALIRGTVATDATDWHWNSGPLMGHPTGDSYTDDRFDLPDKSAPSGESIEKSSLGGGGDTQDFIKQQYLEGSSKECRETPPYLYVTLHDYENVLKYSLDGCLLDHAVLIGAPIEERWEFRGMALSSDGRLFIANAGTGEPQLMRFGKCDYDGRRSYKETVVTDDGRENPGASHAYGVAIDEESGTIYASFQHTDVVLRFDSESFRPLSLPPALQDSSRHRDYYPGTFYQFGQPQLHSLREEGVRGLMVVGHHLWICNEDISGVLVVDTHTGVATDVVNIEAPVGITYSAVHDLVFVGSKVKHWEGRVTAIDRRTLQIVQSYKTLKMTHPTGLQVYGDTLFVAEQDVNRIYEFNILTGEETSKAVDKLPGQVEAILLSDC